MKVCPVRTAYDANGNTITKTDSTGTTNYSWDYENRLVSAALPGSGGAVYFKYDPFGRRIYKSSTSGTSMDIRKWPEKKLFRNSYSTARPVKKWPLLQSNF